MKTSNSFRTGAWRSWLAAVVACVSLAAAAPARAAALPPAPWCPEILTTQHADVFATALVGSSLQMFVDDADDGLLFLPDEVLLYVDRAARTTQPAGTQWSFMGAGAGNPVWVLPQGQNPAVLYAGANANAVSSSSVPSYFESDPRVNASGRWVKTSLLDVRGPGQFSMYQTGSFGTPTVWMSTAQGGITTSDATFLPAGGHAHYNWAFSQPGIYEVDVRASAFLGANQTNPVSSAVTTYFFGVETQLSCPVAVASLDDRRIQAFDVAARPTVLADAGDGFLTPLAAEYNANGDLFVADVLRGQVRRVTPQGTVTLFADTADGLTSPSGLAFDGPGNLFVSNYLTNTITKLNAAGTTSSVFADATDGLVSPFGLDADSLNNLFVADLGNRRVVRFNAAGVPTVFADAADGLLTPFGIAIDTANNVFVSDILTSRIYRFTPAGVGSVFADSGDGLGTPAGLAFDANGDLYAADYLTDRVWKISPTGVASLYADPDDGINSPFDVAGAPFFPPGLGGAGGFSWAAATRSVAVPEPSGFLLAVVAGLGGIAGLRRRCSTK